MKLCTYLSRAHTVYIWLILSRGVSSRLVYDATVYKELFVQLLFFTRVVDRIFFYEVYHLIKL